MSFIFRKLCRDRTSLRFESHIYRGENTQGDRNTSQSISR